MKKAGAAITPLEEKIAAEFATLEATHATLKHDLKPLHFSAAREVEIDATRKAVLLFVPFPLLAEFRKIQKTLVEELEKKLTGYHVLVIANRTMIRLAADEDGANAWDGPAGRAWPCAAAVGGGRG